MTQKNDPLLRQSVGGSMAAAAEAREASFAAATATWRKRGVSSGITINNQLKALAAAAWGWWQHGGGDGCSAARAAFLRRYDDEDIDNGGGGGVGGGTSGGGDWKGRSSMLRWWHITTSPVTIGTEVPSYFVPTS
jgi:hypothetical protein